MVEFVVIVLFSPLSKLAKMAIYFTFRNLACSANLPTGQYILLALISSFFFIFLL